VPSLDYIIFYENNIRCMLDLSWVQKQCSAFAASNTAGAESMALVGIGTIFVNCPQHVQLTSN